MKTGPSTFKRIFIPGFPSRLQQLQFFSGPSCFFFLVHGRLSGSYPVLTFLASWLLQFLLLGLCFHLLLGSAALLLILVGLLPHRVATWGMEFGGGFTPNWFPELTLGGLSTCRLTCGFPSGCLVFFQQFLAGWLPPYVTGVGGSLGVSISLTGFF